MAEPLKDLIDLLHKSDDLIMDLQKSAGPEELKIIKEADEHLDEAYKSLKKLEGRIALSRIVKKANAQS